MKKTKLTKYFILVTLSVLIGIFIGWYKPIPQAAKDYAKGYAKGYQLIPLGNNEQNQIKSEIKSFLISEIPEIIDADELGKVILLRDYVYGNFKLGTNRTPYIYKFDMKRYFFSNLSSNSNYSGLCGSYAALYHIALYAFDIPSRIVGLFTTVKHDSYDSHVSIMVYYSNEDRWIIQDPTFNISVVHNDGRFISYLQLKNKIRNVLDYKFITNGKCVYEDRLVENYYIPYADLINYIYTSQYANWDGIINTDLGEQDYNDDNNLITYKNRRFRLEFN